MEDNIEFTCPNCSASLGLDEVGDLELKAYPQSKPGQRTGLGGLQTIEADPGWQERAYHFNNVEKLAKHQMQEPSNAGADPKKKRTKRAAVRMTPELQIALDKDLSAKNIKLNLTESEND